MFDSYVHKNLLHYGSSIIPDLPCKPIIQREVDSGLPFERLINNALDEYNKNGDMEEIKTKTIMYSKKGDCAAFINYRAINNRSTFSNPEFDYLCSDNFSFEDYQNLTK